MVKLILKTEQLDICFLGESEAEEIDKSFVEHIPAQVKQVQQRCISKEIQSKMTPEEIKREYEVRKQQLEEIYKLMKEQDESFGINSMDDISEQVQYYMWDIALSHSDTATLVVNIYVFDLKNF